MAFTPLLGLFVFVHVISAFRLKGSIPLPREWTPYGDPTRDHSIELQLALKQSNFVALETHLNEISDPLHERYGQHLSKREVEQLVKPHPDTLGTVNAWLSVYSIGPEVVRRSPSEDWITVKLPVSTVEDMLNTKYQLWKHIESDEYIIRTLNYSLPEHLYDLIDAVQPTTMFAKGGAFKSSIHYPARARLSSGTSESTGTIVDPDTGLVIDAHCNATITISCLQQIYNATGYTPQPPFKYRLGITGFLEQYANVADFMTFQTNQVQGAPQNDFSVENINGGLNSQYPQDAGAEANLDVQFAYGVASPIPGIFYSTAGRPPFSPDNVTTSNTNEPYADWLNYMVDEELLPSVISTSYGDDEQTVPIEYAERVCRGFAQLGARGVSLIVASGDGGVGDGSVSPNDHRCVSNDGLATPKFLPAFPASCPYVTSVGGTYRIPERGIEFSGGGFSDYFARPPWQEAAVQQFYTSLPNGTYEGLYNRTGRGIPDVSAQSYNFRIFQGGRPLLIGGTSASAPAFAGFVAMLNDARVKVGLSPLGYLNPWLYRRGFEAFKDVKVGNAPGCGTPGFSATEGWDPVTGLGTPNFGKLKDLVRTVQDESAGNELNKTEGA